MTYDKDLRSSRRVTTVMVVSNLAAAGILAWRHEWPMVPACLIWAASCSVFFRFTRNQQITRDETRITAAAIRVEKDYGQD